MVPSFAVHLRWSHPGRTKRGCTFGAKNTTCIIIFVCLYTPCTPYRFNASSLVPFFVLQCTRGCTSSLHRRCIVKKKKSNALRRCEARMHLYTVSSAPALVKHGYAPQGYASKMSETLGGGGPILRSAPGPFRIFDAYHRRACIFLCSSRFAPQVHCEGWDHRRCISKIRSDAHTSGEEAYASGKGMQYTMHHRCK